MNQVSKNDVKIEFCNNNTFNVEMLFTMLLIVFCTLFAFMESTFVGIMILISGSIVGIIFLYFEFRTYSKKKVSDLIIINDEIIQFTHRNSDLKDIDNPSIYVNFKSINMYENNKFIFNNSLTFHYCEDDLEKKFVYRPPIFTVLNKDQWQQLLEEIRKRIPQDAEVVVKKK